MKGDKDRVLLIFLWGLAVSFVVSGGWMLWRERESGGWPAVAAEILETGIRVTMSSGRGPRMESGPMYGPKVRYRYVVDGRTYTSDRIGMVGWSTSNKAAVEQWLAAYPVRGTAVARYNPAHPEEAVLAGQSSWLGWIFLTVGILLGGALSLLVRRR